MITPTDRDRILDWLLAGDHVGISSMAIATVGLYDDWATRRTRAGPLRRSNPWDPDDLRRCFRLLDMVPSLQDVAFPRLAGISAAWALLIKDWDGLRWSLEAEGGRGYMTSTGWMAPRTYHRMRCLIKQAERMEAAA